MDTTDLLNYLQDGGCSLDSYFQNNNLQFKNDNINTFWESLINESGYSKSNIINKSDFNYRYFYDVINGKKMPTKDKVVRLALAMKLSVEQCQEALKISGRASLYPKIRRDSILIYAIENKLTIFKCDELLQKYGEDYLK